MQHSPHLRRAIVSAIAALATGLSACTVDEALRPPASIAIAPPPVAPAPVFAAPEPWDPEPRSLAQESAEAGLAESPAEIAAELESSSLEAEIAASLPMPVEQEARLAAAMPVPPAPVAPQPAPRNYGYAMPAPLQPEPLPASEVACRQRLKKLGVVFEDIAPIRGPGQCGIDHPVKVSGLPRGVRMKPAATLTCAMAEAFALWTRDELTPAARKRYLSGVATIHQGSSYSCRTIGNKRGGTLSAHGRGNALDVMKITLNNGREIDVRKPGLFAFRERSLLKSVRGDACDYFTTVLGPGYNHDHRDHFHFDLMQRKSGRRACH